MLISGIITLITLVTFAIGGLLNGLEIWLIVFHSPKGMRVYRQILLQISTTDVLTLVIALLTQPVSDLNTKNDKPFLTETKINSYFFTITIRYKY